jgi:hypothetical protein
MISYPKDDAELGDSSQLDELANHSKKSFFNKPADIVFLYPEVTVKRNTQGCLVSLDQNQLLSGEMMFRKIVDTASRTNISLHMVQDFLNSKNLNEVMKQTVPKVLFIVCHGGFEATKSFFCFEDSNSPTLVDPMHADVLKQLINGSMV